MSASTQVFVFASTTSVRKRQADGLATTPCALGTNPLAYAERRLSDDKKAKRVFQEIDDNSGGVILLDEWSSWLKAQEVAEKTPLGDTLRCGHHLRISCERQTS